MSRKKINQSDLRRLMKERSGGLAEKIESPLAKYDSQGRLSCIACNEEINSIVPWRCHILSKKHKENVTKKLKRKASEPEIPIIPKKNTDAVVTSKFSEKTVNGNTLGAAATKRLKAEDENPSLITSYSSSSEEEEDEPQKAVQPSSSSSSLQTTSASSLPLDFFDAPPPFLTESSKSLTSVAETSHSKQANSATAASSNTLPEGFFDDPFLDAKARNIEYKDPKEEEWEKFQKTIAEETTVSENIIEVDAEESAINKNIDQIDEQIHKWQKVNELLYMRENALQKAHLKKSEESQDGDDSPVEEDDLEDLLNWRAKDLWKKS